MLIQHSFAKQRLAVIIGTSTSGIADNEPVLKVAVSTVCTAVCTAPKARNGQFSEGLTTVFGLGRALPIPFLPLVPRQLKTLAAGQRLLNADLADAVLVGGVDTLCKLTFKWF